ncbi:FAD-dependent oxidoreductase [Mycolicibacter minnesotensis]
MTHLITRACCNDASCVRVCPVNCIHPTPAEPGFLTAEMLYIDPATCIDCGQCLDECPVSAIVRDDEMTAEHRPFLAINADYYRDHDVNGGVYPAARRKPQDLAALRVAIVGAGPSGFFVGERLLEPNINVSVDMFDMLPTPYGLVRAGVAPDHQDTKGVQKIFERVSQHQGFRYFLNVAVGQDIKHEELAQHYHAVVYATGASGDRRLGIGGEDLRNSLSAAQIVAWYNGRPGQRPPGIDLSVENAVIIGNGNVALDLARILATDVEKLRQSDIPSDVLTVLGGSALKRITVMARRDVARAAYSATEFLSLSQRDDIAIDIRAEELQLDPQTQKAYEGGTLDSVTAAKIRLAAEVAERGRGGAGSAARTVDFAYLTTPLELIGEGGACAGVRVQRGGYDADGVLTPLREEIIPAGLVIRAIGYSGDPIPALPFDEGRAIVPNTAGRVSGVPGAYVAGWIKRGAQGGIGRNRHCSLETAESLLEDFRDAALLEPTYGPNAIMDVLADRRVFVIDADGWRRVDEFEIHRGRSRSAPREKIVAVDEILSVAHRSA